MRALNAVLIAGLLAGILPAAAESASRIDRPGTTMIGLGGSWGLVTGEGRYGLDFGNGGGYFISLKHTVTRNLALGFRFENQSFGWVDGIRDAGGSLVEDPYDHMIITTFEGLLYYYHHRSEDASPYVVAGIGVYRPELRRKADDTVFPGENLMGSLGLGAELFLRENLSIDLSGRGTLLYGNGYAEGEITGFDDFALEQANATSKASFSMQISAGLLYYLLK
jgi:opacity protein-like surface antigen